MGRRTPTGRRAPDRSVQAEVRRVWDANAEFWDERMGEGNTFHRYLNRPTLERLLALRGGERVLEIACGNGQFARQLAELGAQVLAVDASPGMLAKARARTTPAHGRIEYRELDVTDPAALAALGRFDAVVASMAMMDIPTIEPLAHALPTLLVPGGAFVFSVCHPAFNNASMRRQIAEEYPEGVLVETKAVLVTHYATPRATRSIAMIGQPETQPFFDRSLSDLLRPFLAAGLVLDALEEPVFPSEALPARPLSWENFREIPPLLAARVRRPGAPRRRARG